MIPYHIRQAFKGMFRHLGMTLSAIVAVIITLLLLAIFLCVAGNVSLFASNIEGGLQIHATLDPDIDTEEELEEAGNVLKEMDNVAAATLSTKDEELELMIKEKGEAFAMYRGEENPLNNAFFITVVDADQIAQTCEAISQLDFVNDAVYGGASVSQLIHILDLVRQGGLVFVILLFLLTAYLISSTIRTTIYARSKEIAIMRLVGASNGFIRGPFLMEGALHALIGSLLAVGVLQVLRMYGIPKLQSALSFLSLDVSGNTYIMIYIVLVVAGLVIGLLGSAFAMRRYLKV